MTFRTWNEPEINERHSTIFDRPFSPIGYGTEREFHHLPFVNISENDEEFHLALAAPGLKKADFDIDLENDVLTISGQLKESVDRKNENYTRREFGFESFSRSFTIPHFVDKDAISAHYEDGILMVTLPKTVEGRKHKPKTIQVE